nr:hypothetical protein Ccrd_003276 [Ipomoea batatas]
MVTRNITDFNTIFKNKFRSVRTTTLSLVQVGIINLPNLNSSPLTGSRRTILRRQRFLANYLINIQQYGLERLVHVNSFHGRGFEERQSFFLGHALPILLRHGPQVVQVGLVPNHHNHDVGIGMVPKFTQPPVNILEGLPFGYVIYQKCPHCASIVRAGDRPIPFLPRRVPYLGFHGLPLDLQNSFLVNLESMLDFPTPESPINTILNK